MFEDGENIKEAEDVCSDEIKISLDVEGLDERVAQKEQQVAQKEQQVAKWQKAKKVVEDVAKEQQGLASATSELIFTDNIKKVLQKINSVVENKKINYNDVSEINNYVENMYR